MTYYLKKLGHQELGSVTPTRPTPSRGRYIYISKNINVLSFFPPLSQTVKNDSSLLPIIPLYLNEPTKIYCNYIYHNDHLFGGSRNEYRIYLNNALENNSFLFTSTDIIVFKKEEIKIEEEIQIVYFLELLKTTDNLYDLCNDIIENSSIRGDHATYDGELKIIDDKISRFLQHGTFNPVVDETVAKKVEESSTNIENLFNATSFRDFVMTGYGGVCAITGNVIKYGQFNNLETAHIKPKSHGGTYLPNNGIPLSRDIHWAFDKGFFTLSDDYTIMVHEKVENEYLASLDGSKIKIPENEFFIPDKSSLKYHRNNVYGLFLTSGRL
ncbi:HNH endonuclease [Psychrobacillus sp. NPDC096426]|uniref:HNH endonuclease n=1 Tax=Psychrobacillus sp. NPDC096426 TaxID=3364491 RepID=UPI0037F972D8